MTRRAVKLVCDDLDCNRLVRNAHFDKKGRRLCFSCWRKDLTIIGGPLSKNRISLEKALKKEYNVGTYVTKKGYTHCQIHLPQCFSGKKVKVKIVE